MWDIIVGYANLVWEDFQRTPSWQYWLVPVVLFWWLEARDAITRHQREEHIE